VQTQSTDERDLVRRLRRGDRLALDAFMATYMDRLYQFVLYRAVLNRQAAEDITQESLVAALNGLERFDGRAALYTWLCGIARHKLADYFRRQERFEQVRVALAAQSGEPPGPPELLEREERRRQIVAVLRGLSPRYQQALTLKYLDHLSGYDLAAELELSEDAAESLLARARKAFRRAYREQAPSSGGSTVHESL
jgi:RNA polymerase sigma-70 factor, ECF subfamily